MQHNTRGRHLKDSLAVLSRRRVWALGVGFVVFALVVLITLLTPNRFQGSAKILVEKALPDDLVRQSRTVLRDPAFLETQVQLIKSIAVAERVVESLQVDPETAPLLEQAATEGVASKAGRLLAVVKHLFTRDAPSADTVDPADDFSALAARLSEDITVRALQDSNVLTINYLSKNPELAARVANTVADAYVAETQNMRVSAVRQGLERMSEKARLEGARLEDAEKELYDYMETHGLFSAENRTAMTAQELSEVSGSLIRAELKRKELEVLVGKVREMEKNGDELESLDVIASNPTLQLIRTQILASEKNILEMSSKYGPKHPVMKKAVNDVTMLRSRKEHEIRRIVTALRNEYDIALQKERSLRARLEETRAHTLDLNEKYVRYEALLRQVDTNQKLYAALLLQMKEQDVTAEHQSVNVWVIEAAVPSEEPARPQVKLNLLVGLFSSLLAGVMAVFAREYFDSTLITPDDLEALLEETVLGVIPEGKGKGARAEAVLLEETFSVRADSYKSLRTSVHLAGHGEAPRTILVTSPGSGEGKTVTALNLAYAMAQVNLKVLLIDADMRRPSIHEALGLENCVGLSSYLMRECEIRDGVEPSVISGGGSLQQGPLETLYVMTSGPVPPNPSELLSGGHLDELLEILSRRFDRIICDSPPMISVPDTQILCGHFSGTVLVVRSDTTTKEMASRAARMIRAARGNILGSVLNGYNLREANAYYANYYPSTYRSASTGVGGKNSLTTAG